jgi:hypothetical protein
VVVRSVLVVVASVVVDAAMVVETVVVGAAVLDGAVTGGWVVVAPKVENASMIVVTPELADTWALAGPGALVGVLTARGTVSGVGSERADAVVGSRGPWWASARVSVAARPGRSAAPA